MRLKLPGDSIVNVHVPVCKVGGLNWPCCALEVGPVHLTCVVPDDGPSKKALIRYGESPEGRERLRMEGKRMRQTEAEDEAYRRERFQSKVEAAFAAVGRQ